MTQIQERAQALVDEFALFDDWMDKYQYLIDLGASVPTIDPAFRSDDYRIQGCQAQVWLHAEPRGPAIHFTADSDAQITRGLIAALLRVLNDQPAGAVAAADLGFLDDIGMQEHLSPSRKNGLDSMIKQIRLYAAAIAASQSE